MDNRRVGGKVKARRWGERNGEEGEEDVIMEEINGESKETEAEKKAI